MCKSCVGKCREIVSDQQPIDIECPACGGDGCSQCNEGWFQVRQCPSEFIGSELVSDIMLTTATENHLPVSGGLLDQSAWWFSLRQALKAEENRIEREQQNR